MREIKFRAWDKKDKIMWEPMTLSDLILGGWEMENSDGSWSLPHDDYIQFSHDETIWMQYTGLKDKNGKEIYEGDIVRGHKGEGYNIDVIGIVEYGGLSFAYVGKGKSEHWFDTITTPTMTQDKYIEVIGNIYENPELIKGELK